MSTLEQQIANLRLEMNALTQSARTASLPDALTSIRKTVRWSAVIIAVALVVSSFVRLVDDKRVEQLEKRVELLEKKR